MKRAEFSRGKKETRCIDGYERGDKSSIKNSRWRNKPDRKRSAERGAVLPELLAAPGENLKGCKRFSGCKSTKDTRGLLDPEVHLAYGMRKWCNDVKLVGWKLKTNLFLLFFFFSLGLVKIDSSDCHSNYNTYNMIIRFLKISFLNRFKFNIAMQGIDSSDGFKTIQKVMEGCFNLPWIVELNVSDILRWFI